MIVTDRYGTHSPTPAECWCGEPATHRYPVDLAVTTPNTTMSDGITPGLAACEFHTWGRDGAEALEAPEAAEDGDTLGACGCTDYHLSDCPTRDTRGSAWWDPGDLQDRWYEDDYR